MRFGQQRNCFLQPQFIDVCGERRFRRCEQLLQIPSRNAPLTRHRRDAEGRIIEVAGDIADGSAEVCGCDRAQSTLADDAVRCDRKRSEVDEMPANGLPTFQPSVEAAPFERANIGAHQLHGFGPLRQALHYGVADVNDASFEFGMRNDQWDVAKFLT